mgnify:CR=1
MTCEYMIEMSYCRVRPCTRTATTLLTQAPKGTAHPERFDIHLCTTHAKLWVNSGRVIVFQERLTKWPGRGKLEPAS